MIISCGRRYIFVHAPKTGGTALTLALEARALKDDLLVGDTPKARKRRGRLKELSPRGRLWKHSTLADIDGVVSLEELDDYFLFTLVRNPWDRMVSYYHWLKEQSFDHPVVALANELAFEPFVLHSAVRASFQKATFGSYLVDARGNERDATFVRLEHLDVDLAPVEAHLGFKLGPVERVNASERRADYRSYFSRATRMAVADACAEDINRFGYEF